MDRGVLRYNHQVHSHFDQGHDHSATIQNHAFEKKSNLTTQFNYNLTVLF
jgi:hypothetical protein